MLFLTRGRWRTATTAVAAGALAATTLAFAGSPAQAAEGPSVTANVAVDGESLDVSVAGTGFDPYSRPGAAGVYAAVVDKQDIVGLTAADFIGTAYVMPSQFTDGAFDETVSVDIDKLVEDTEYAVYTWTAHGNPTAGDSQYTETVIEIPAEVFADEVTPPVVSATATANGNKIKIAVSATNVVPDTNAQDYVDGVYLGFAEKQDIFTESEGQEDGMEKFIASAHISGPIAGGAFTRTFTIAKKKLARGKTYALYTWTAHGNPKPTDSQYTETVVKVPGLPKNATMTGVKFKKKPSTKKRGKAVVTVRGVPGVQVTGKVRVVLKKGKQTKKATAKLNKKGKAGVNVAKLGKGQWRIAAKYLADKNYKKSKKVKKFKIKK